MYSEYKAVFGTLGRTSTDTLDTSESTRIKLVRVGCLQRRDSTATESFLVAISNCMREWSPPGRVFGVDIDISGSWICSHSSFELASISGVLKSSCNTP